MGPLPNLRVRLAGNPMQIIHLSISVNIVIYPLGKRWWSKLHRLSSTSTMEVSGYIHHKPPHHYLIDTPCHEHKYRCGATWCRQVFPSGHFHYAECNFLNLVSHPSLVNTQHSNIMWCRMKLGTRTSPSCPIRSFTECLWVTGQGHI